MFLDEEMFARQQAFAVYAATLSTDEQ
jgi:hypothetical protein